MKRLPIISGIGNTLRLSAQELKRPSSLVGVAMLCAVNVVLGQFSIQFTPTLKIGFAFLPVGVCGMMYGPVLSGMAGIVNDVIKYLLKPTGPYMVGFTLIEGLQGVIYGLFLYRKRITVPRIFFTRLCIIVFLNLLLTPLFLSMLYGKGFVVLVAGRLVKNLVMLPIETFVQFLLLRTVSQLPIPQLRGKQAH